MVSCADFFDNTVTLITGGSGSFGNEFVKRLLAGSKTAKVVVLSRDEYKQYQMKNRFHEAVHAGRLSFKIGDVRNREKLVSAFRGIDYVIHAAALKQVPICEENIEETVLTNINGALNVRYAAEANQIKKALAISTDKAVYPVNLYGATKMVSDKVFTDMSQSSNTIFSIVRYGNVATSRGSIIPLFEEIRRYGQHTYPITDEHMTRFWVSLPEAVDLAVTALMTSRGGETFVAKLPSFRIVDLVSAIDPTGVKTTIGIRPGEKIHEIMVTKYDAPKTVDAGGYYIVFPSVELARDSGKPQVSDEFEYLSESNSDWLSVSQLQARLRGVMDE